MKKITVNDLRIDTQFTIGTSSHGVKFKITRIDKKRDCINYQVIEGGNVGQVNKDILGDFIYIANNNNINILKD